MNTHLEPILMFDKGSVKNKQQLPVPIKVYILTASVNRAKILLTDAVNVRCF